MIRIHKPFLFTLATFALMTLSACASTNSVDTTDSVAVLPDAEPGIRGVITKSDSNVGSRFILVEEKPGDATGSQKAAVRLTDQTKIYRRSGSSFEAIGHAVEFPPFSGHTERERLIIPLRRCVNERETQKVHQRV